MDQFRSAFIECRKIVILQKLNCVPLFVAHAWAWNSFILIVYFMYYDYYFRSLFISFRHRHLVCQHFWASGTRTRGIDNLLRITVLRLFMSHKGLVDRCKKWCNMVRDSAGNPYCLRFSMHQCTYFGIVLMCAFQSHE